MFTRPAAVLGTTSVQSDRPGELARANQTSAYLLLAAETTDPIAKERLMTKAVLLNVPMADRLARRYTGRGIPTEDLVQVARVGLIHAVHRFDPAAGFDFRSYARPTITGELKRHFRDFGWVVRPPRPIQELRSRASAATPELSQALGRTPTRRELAEHLGSEEAKMAEALASGSCYSPASLDGPVRGDTQGDRTWLDEGGYEDPGFARVEANLMLAPVLRRLCERDRHVLELRFAGDLTQGDIGLQLGLSQAQVSRILARIKGLIVDEFAR